MINLKKDYKDYLALLSVLSFAMLGFVFFGYDRFLQQVIIVLTGVFYVVWGTLHHALKKDLHLKVFLEYFTVALLATVLVLTLLARV